MTPDSIPWDDFDCLFIGGNDAFKESGLIRRTCREAKRRRKWVVVPHSANAVRTVSGTSSIERVIATESRPRGIKTVRLRGLQEGAAPLGRRRVGHGTATRQSFASG